MPDTTRVASLQDNYVHTLFQRFKETHFEQMLLMAFVRNLDLAQVILTDQLPKGQRIFSENDVREFIEGFNKQEMHIHFLVAKNAILSRSLPAPVLDNYESALRDLLNEVTRGVGEKGLPKKAQEAKEDAVQPEGVTKTPASFERSRLRPTTPIGPARRLVHLVISPLWHVLFPLPVLLGWLAEIPTWPLLEMALFTSAAFAVAPAVAYASKRAGSRSSARAWCTPPCSRRWVSTASATQDGRSGWGRRGSPCSATTSLTSGFSTIPTSGSSTRSPDEAAHDSMAPPLL